MMTGIIFPHESWIQIPDFMCVGRTFFSMIVVWLTQQDVAGCKSRWEKEDDSMSCSSCEGVRVKEWRRWSRKSESLPGEELTGRRATWNMDKTSRKCNDSLLIPIACATHKGLFYGFARRLLPSSDFTFANKLHQTSFLETRMIRLSYL